MDIAGARGLITGGARGLSRTFALENDFVNRRVIPVVGPSGDDAGKNKNERLRRLRWMR